VIAVLVTLAVAAVVGTLWRVRDGRFRSRRAASASSSAVDGALLAELGVELGERATLLQFSSAFCQPCRATRRILARVSESVPGVTHVDVDAEANLAAVRALGISSTPTTLILDGLGRERQRATGTPRLEQVLAAVSATPTEPRLDGRSR
jgi:thiol-disulfide isomerase/thioredoxin